MGNRTDRRFTDIDDAETDLDAFAESDDVADVDATEAEADELECEDYYQAFARKCAAELRSSLNLPGWTAQERRSIENSIVFFDREVGRIS